MDIVERLLDYVEGVGVSEYKSDMSSYVAKIMQDAADEIERLREALREAELKLCSRYFPSKEGE